MKCDHSRSQIEKSGAHEPGLLKHFTQGFLIRMNPYGFCQIAIAVRAFRHMLSQPWQHGK